MRLLEGLTKVHLISINDPSNYAVTCNQNILIYTNKQEKLSYNHFKDGPLRPYLYVCLVH